MPRLGISIVSLNSACDRTVGVDALGVGAVHVARRETIAAGGKGLNVLRVASALDLRARAIAFAGGDTGRLLRRLVRREGLRAEWLTTAAESRTCTIIVDSVGRATVVNGRGPDIRPGELAALAERLFARAAKGDVVVLTGSVPPGVPDDIYATWTERCRTLGARAVFLDAAGPLLRAGVAARPDVVKVNAAEFGALLAGRSLLDGAAELIATGVGTVVITLGAEGSVAVGAHGAPLRVGIAPLGTVNATGSGDAFLAGFLLGAVEGCALAESMALGSAAGALCAGEFGPASVSRERLWTFARAVRVEPLGAM